MSAIDLSRLPVPNVIEPLDVERIFQATLADLKQKDATLVEGLTDTDPLWKLLQVCAYRELVIRQRVNDAAKAVMLAYAQQADLDHIAAGYGVKRLTLHPGNPSANPPLPAIMEEDEALRSRTQLSLDGLSVAGPEGAYRFHAKSASGDVLDAKPSSPTPGHVIITVLSRTGNGLASPALLQQVERAVNAEDIRPLTDYVTVQSARIVEYALKATLYLYSGPDANVVIANARKATERYVNDRQRIGQDVTLSGLYGALQQPGVQRVELHSPSNTLNIDHYSASFCTGIALTFGGIDE